jgi:subtilase family serine protease
MNPPKLPHRLNPRRGWSGRRGTQAGRAAGGGNGRRRLWAGIATGAAALLAVAFAGSAMASPGVTHARSAAASAPAQNLISGFGCAKASLPGQVHCLGEIRSHRASNGRIAPKVTSGPVGFGPSDLQSAYKLAGASGNGRTVAVVDAMDDPKAQSDLAVYRKAYGLPACTTANGCLKKVNQSGQASPLPAGDYGWAEEESLDLDMVSAACPACHIALVEANGTDTTALSKAEQTAASIPGVVAISNSYGGSEDSSTRAADPAYRHPGIAVTASSGDSGYSGGVIWPASSPYVTAVGGTSLSKASNARGWTETAWSGAGSGCSTNEPKPSWQHDSGCARRTVADVSAVADPNTGVAVYDTYNNCGSSAACDILIQAGVEQGLDGWAQVGGTSASSPLIAGVYALAGNTASIVSGSYPYSHQSSLYDVTSGSTGSCSSSYLCTAGPGYDGPAGLGTPHGTGAF